MMETIRFEKGMRVRTANYNISFYERLHANNHVSWNPRMATYIGKIGIVKDVNGNGVQVTFFSWGSAESSITSDGKQTEAPRNIVVEATYAWHLSTIIAAQTLHFLDGDRAIMVKNKDLSKVTMVSVQVADNNGYLSLRLPHSNTFFWNQLENPNDVLLPVYAGRNLTSLMRDRNLPPSLALLDHTPARIVFGVPETPSDPHTLVDAIRLWAENGNEQPFRIALYKNPKLKNAIVDGRSPLMLAVELGLWTAAAVMFCIGADSKVVDGDGNGLFHIAARRGHEKIIEGMLIFAADEVNRRNALGETALHTATATGNVACMDRLLNAPNIDPNIQDNEGNTALHILADMDDVSSRGAMLHRMLSNVKVNYVIVNKGGFTPLQVAVARGQAKVVESMIKMKPSLLVSEGCQSMLPLHLAAAYGRSNVLDVIFKLSADATRLTNARRTALHFAVERWDGSANQDMQRLACIQSLVTMGVPLNVRDCDGSTALHLAARVTPNQISITKSKIDTLIQMKKPNLRLEEIASVIRPQWQVAVVCFLISQGCDCQTRDRNGVSPFACITDNNLRYIFNEYAACQSRSCLPMSSSIARNFDPSGVTICTFNCEDNVADIVFVPCGHRVVCATCVGNTLLKRCPLCYQQISSANNSKGQEVEIGGNIAKLKDGNGDCIQEPSEKNKFIEEVEIQRIAQEAAEEAKKAAEKEKNAIVQELRDKLEQLEMEMCCPICMDQRCNVVFQCGHTSCSNCSSPARLKHCHICRQPIEIRTTIYT